MVTRRGLCFGVLVAAGVAQGCYSAKEYPLNNEIPLIADADGAVQQDKANIAGHWYGYDDQTDTPSTCTRVGKHSPDECAKLLSPDTSDVDDETCGPHCRRFSNLHGALCAVGYVEPLAECDPMKASLCLPRSVSNLDYGNMWGAGIGLDFSVLDGQRKPWAAKANGITGIAFDLDVPDGDGMNDVDLPLISLRVAFPILFESPVTLPANRGTVLSDGSIITAGIPRAVIPSDTAHLIAGGYELIDGRKVIATDDGNIPLPVNSTSDQFPLGSPTWRVGSTAKSSWNSPVQPGHNELHFSDVLIPPADSVMGADQPDYSFDPDQLLGVQFQAAPDDKQVDRRRFNFCISNLVLLRN